MAGTRRRENGTVIHGRSVRGYEPLELLRTRRTGLGPEDEQFLAFVGIEQPPGVQLQLAQLRMPITLEIVMVRDAHLVPSPDLGELGADGQQRLDDLTGDPGRVGR